MSVLAGGIGAAVGGIGSVVGGVSQAGAAKSAAASQAASAAAALKQQQVQQDYTNARELPYINKGIDGASNATNWLAATPSILLPYQAAMDAATPTHFTQSDLEATPGYQFTLAQGLKSTQNAAAARGLGVSGAALKSAASYATGLSDQTFNTRFGQAQTQYSDASNNLTQQQSWLNGLIGGNQNLASLGGNVAANQGSQGANYANAASTTLTGLGNSQGAAAIGGANALASGFNGVSNALGGFINNPATQNYLQSNGSIFSNGSQFNRATA